jgi:Family of unknown function (DUF7003)
MAKARYTAEEVLRQLDDCAREYDFPMLDNAYVYPGDVRLNAFRDDRRWAVLIEDLGFHYRAGLPDGIYTAVYHYGNCVRGELGMSDDIFANLRWPGDVDEDEGEWGVVPPSLTEVLIRGQPVSVPRDKRTFAAKKIKVSDPRRLEGQALLRVLLPEHRLALLCTEEELRRCILADLPRLATLDAWYHPDLSHDELPSHTQTFRQLARVLVSGNPNELLLTERPNTHWKNWPAGGTF